MKATRKRFHGINLITMITKPENCGGNCVYCFSNDNGNGSLINSEIMEYAAENNWSSSKQVEFGMRILGLKTGDGNKYNLAIKGDSFTNYSFDYLETYLKDAYDSVSGIVTKSFEDALFVQRSAKDRITAISVDTRPDLINDKWCLELVRLGVTTVELGVQSLDNNVLEYINRGHDTEAVKRATALLRKYGFEIGYHLMPGLPGSSLEKDIFHYTNTLWLDDYQPDFIKLYPCIMLNETYRQPKLLALLENSSWSPLSNEKYKYFLHTILPKMPRYISINRYNRMIPESYIYAGPCKRINTNELYGISQDFLQRAFQYSKHFTNRFENITFDIEVIEYGRFNYCLQAKLSDDTVLGYLRMTIFQDYTIIRDIRVFGNPAKLYHSNFHEPGCIQHLGVGKTLLSKAENISKQRGINTMRAYVPAGVTGYFKKMNYYSGRNSLMEKIL